MYSQNQALNRIKNNQLTKEACRQILRTGISKPLIIFIIILVLCLIYFVLVAVLRKWNIFKRNEKHTGHLESNVTTIVEQYIELDETKTKANLGNEYDKIFKDIKLIIKAHTDGKLILKSGKTSKEEQVKYIAFTTIKPVGEEKCKMNIFFTKYKLPASIEADKTNSYQFFNHHYKTGTNKACNKKYNKDISTYMVYDLNPSLNPLEYVKINPEDDNNPEDDKEFLPDIKSIIIKYNEITATKNYKFSIREIAVFDEEVNLIDSSSIIIEYGTTNSSDVYTKSEDAIPDTAKTLLFDKDLKAQYISNQVTSENPTLKITFKDDAKKSISKILINNESVEEKSSTSDNEKVQYHIRLDTEQGYYILKEGIVMKKMTYDGLNISGIISDIDTYANFDDDAPTSILKQAATQVFDKDDFTYYAKTA